MKRLWDTFNVCFEVFMVRTFGRYQHSSWDGTADYSVYEYKGETFYIPVSRNHT